MKGFDRDTSEVDFSYDLEGEMRNEEKFATFSKEIETRIDEMKHLLKDSKDQEKLDEYGTVLHGYLALKKVIQRVKK